MPIIEVPGMGAVDFPDNMSDDDIAKAIRQNMPNQDQPQAVRRDDGFLENIGGQIKRNINVSAKNIGKALPILDELGTRMGLASSSDIELEPTDGYSGGALVGDILSGLLLPTGKTKLAQLGIGALMGGLLSESDQVSGAAVGAAAPSIVRGLGKTIEGAVLDPAQQMLKAEGVRMTPGQLLGGGVNKIEEAFTSVPFIGDAITSARGRGIEGLNKAVAQRALDPIDAQSTLSGRAGVQQAKDIIGAKYDELLPKLSFSVDDELAESVGLIQDQLAKSAGGTKAQTIFNDIARASVYPRIQAGSIDGVTYKAIDSDIGNIAKSLMRSSDTAEREAGRALTGLKRQMYNALQRSNPQFAGELKNVDNAYAQYRLLSEASKRASEANEGIFTPAQLRAAVQSQDLTRGKDAYARGAARMQDLAAAGEKVLGNKLPDSGTATRAMIPAGIAALASGSGLGVSPAMISAAITAPTLYSQPGVAVMQKLIADRPELARYIGSKIGQQSLPLSLPAFGLLGGGE